MKARVLKAIEILAAYVMLNAGVLSWLEVSAAAENKLNPVETAMAEIKKDSEDRLEISVLGKSGVFDFSFIESDEAHTVIFTFIDPIVLAAAETIFDLFP